MNHDGIAINAAAFTPHPEALAALLRAVEKLHKRRERKAAQRKMLIAALIVGGAALALQVRRWQRER
jgi:hypothetical protein